jgi:hypothetical protein
VELRPKVQDKHFSENFFAETELHKMRHQVRAEVAGLRVLAAAAGNVAVVLAGTTLGEQGAVGADTRPASAMQKFKTSLEEEHKGYLHEQLNFVARHDAIPIRKNSSVVVQQHAIQFHYE